MVSLVAYQGLRTPEELLALEVKHVRKNTLLVEQRNIVGKIVGGQKVRGFHPRAIDLLDPVRRDLHEYLLATGIRRGPLFPRRDGEPWRLHDYNNWRQRVWKKGREAAGVDPLPPYDLRHAFASLQIRAGMLRGCPPPARPTCGRRGGRCRPTASWSTTGGLSRPAAGRQRPPCPS
jgi:integrase